MKIHSLSIENTKRVKAVTIEPAQDGLTVIGGRNGQGKTSVLDAIAWALGGDRFRPTDAHREGSVLPPYIKVTLDNGIVVERKGKNSALTVNDPTCRRGGQQLLNEFISELALNLPKFMESNDKEKAQTLLQIIGVGDKLTELDNKEKKACNDRLLLGREADQKEAFVKSMPYYTDAPKDLISISELIRRQQDILARNGENQRLRMNRDNLLADRHRISQKLQDITAEYDQICRLCEIAEKEAEDLQDESTAEIEREIAEIDDINRKVRANLDHDKAEEDAREATNKYNQMTAQINELRKQRTQLLNGAQLPLPGLGVEDGALTYNGRKWDCMSASEQLRVSAAIVRKLKPDCGFVLMDKLEQMDPQTLEEFGAWLKQEGLQAIATRVSTGGECQIIIEDGYAVEAEAKEPAKAWTKGVFGK